MVEVEVAVVVVAEAEAEAEAVESGTVPEFDPVLGPRPYLFLLNMWGSGVSEMLENGL